MRGATVKTLRRAVSGMKLTNRQWRNVKRAYEEQPRDRKNVGAAVRRTR